MRETWEALGEVKALITSPKVESCQPGLGNDPGQSFTLGFPEGTSCDAENNLYAVELLQVTKKTLLYYGLEMPDFKD